MPKARKADSKELDIVEDRAKLENVDEIVKTDVEETPLVDELSTSKNDSTDVTQEEPTSVAEDHNTSIDNHQDQKDEKELVVEEPIIPTIVKETEKSVPIEIVKPKEEEENQNYILGARLQIYSQNSDHEEIVRKNPKYRSVSNLNQMLALYKPTSHPIDCKGENTMRTYRRTEEEETLMNKRDYYDVTGREGDHFPPETDLAYMTSPQKINLSLDQVRSLVLNGFRLKNLRTGDVVNKRRLDEYIAKWSKDKNPIISNKVYY